MSWFNRKNNSNIQDDYLQTTETVSRPLAVVFTIIIVLVMAAAVFSLFLGGRWLFQHLDGSNKSTQIEVVENPITVTPPVAASTSSGSNTSSSANSSTAPNNTSGTTSTTTQPKPVTTPTPASSPSSPSATTIPATGTTEVVAVFITTALLATFIHSLWLRRSNT